MNRGLALVFAFGTVGIVGYVVLRSRQAAAETAGPPPPPPGTLIPLSPQAAAPTAPVPAPAAAPTAVQTAFENPPRLLPDPFRVVPGQRYRWRFQKGSFDVASSGFLDVKTYDQPMQLPPDWPPSMVAESPMTGYASGTWGGQAGTLTKPFGMYQIWPTMAST